MHFVEEQLVGSPMATILTKSSFTHDRARLVRGLLVTMLTTPARLVCLKPRQEVCTDRGLHLSLCTVGVPFFECAFSTNFGDISSLSCHQRRDREIVEVLKSLSRWFRPLFKNTSCSVS